MPCFIFDEGGSPKVGDAKSDRVEKQQSTCKREGFGRLDKPEEKEKVFGRLMARPDNLSNSFNTTRTFWTDFGFVFNKKLEVICNSQAQAFDNLVVANYDRKLRDLRKEAGCVKARLDLMRGSVNDRIAGEIAKISGVLAEAKVAAEDAVVRAVMVVAERDEVAGKLAGLSRELERVKGETCSYTDRCFVLESSRIKWRAEEDARARREIAAAEESVRQEFLLRVQPVLDRVRQYLDTQKRLEAANQLTMYQACAKCVERLRSEWKVEIPDDYDAELALDLAEAQQAVDAIPIVELDDADLDIWILDQHGTNASLISPEDASELRGPPAGES